MKALQKLLLIFIITLTSSVSLAKETAKTENPRHPYIQEEMRLLNTYLKGLDSELKQAEPQMAQLDLLSQLILESARKIAASKENQTFHDHLKTLLRDTQALQRFSSKNQITAALQQANSLRKNCIECHLSQLKN